MKIRILEYEEDPNHGSSSSSREQPIREYTIEVAANKTKLPQVTTIVSRRRDNGDLLRSPLKLLTKLFLPLGYPHSVSDTYLPYQLYDGLQGLCSYWRGVVSAKAVFEAAGVGNSEATALSAALSWALRDGTGMIGGLLYSYVASPYFDSHAKEFRLLLADVINDIALTLDMIAPWFGPDGSIWILGLSTIGKTICGITAGATKGHITQHFAKDGGNVADLTAKESTQETLVSLLGMVGGVWVAKVLDRYCQENLFFWTWLFFGILTGIHVWANYKAVSLLKLATLNPERTRVLFRESINAMADQVLKAGDKATENTSLTPPSALKSISNLQSPQAIEESLFSSTLNLLSPRICVSKSPNLNRLQDCSLYRESELEPNLQYVIGYDVRGIIYVWLKVGATMEDELQAYVHALLLQKLFSNRNRITESQKDDLLQSTRTQVLMFFGGNTLGDQQTQKSLMERLKQLGWDFRGRLHLGFSSCRLQTSMKED